MTETLRELLTQYAASKNQPLPTKTLAMPAEYFSQHPDTSELEFMSFVGRHHLIPIADKFDYSPDQEILLRAQWLEWPTTPNGFIPVAAAGPGLYLAHYDPFAPIPESLHPHNAQVVMVSALKYSELKKHWQTAYRPQPTEDLVKPDPESTVPTKDQKQWLEWQIESGNHPPSIVARIQDALSEGTTDRLGPDWTFWYETQENGCKAAPVIHKDLREAEGIQDKFLKQIEGIILFSTKDLVQIGHVENLLHWPILENLSTQFAESGSTLKVFKICRKDYNRFEDDAALQRLNENTFTTAITEGEGLSEVEIIDPRKLSEKQQEDDPGGTTNNLLQFLIFQGVKLGASDIHIEPNDTCYQIRVCINRINSVFRNNVQKQQGRALVNLIKVKAGIDINEQRLPADGKIRVFLRKAPIELRVATIPVNDPARREEAVTIRLLSAAGQFPSLERIGMPQDQLKQFRIATRLDSGIIVVTGPTGHGKTTTLYAAMQELDRVKLNVISIEDPVEAVIPGIRQTQVSNTIGMSFAIALRSILRQNPNVILIGEIRDQEVANIAITSANTGHLVLTTLHTNSAAMAIGRLLDLKAQKYQMASSLRLITAQRLVPVLCENCRLPYHPTDEDRDIIQTLTRVQLQEDLFIENPRGCQYCRNGISGMRVVMESITFGKRLREAVLRDASAQEIEDIASETCGFRPFVQGTMEGVNEGRFSLNTAVKLLVDI